MGSISQQALSVHACTAPATLFILYDIKQCSFSAGQLTAAVRANPKRAFHIAKGEQGKSDAQPQRPSLEAPDSCQGYLEFLQSTDDFCGRHSSPVFTFVSGYASASG
ncbi:hypothetical protein CIHG_06276 [Coccidioides immitis H538.4]|uniref:Uncharacterized protein n=1 Tax=Coccidioides immitis H538.4 TaxID=396776 RepID=A0A0J8RV92_COCIT|nr:hypothetical protein CIHG_06276 [Coccidioides immitis H538.4]